MPRRTPPKHRAAPASRRGARTLLSGLAVAAAGALVTGVLLDGTTPADSPVAATLAAAEPSGVDQELLARMDAERGGVTASRSDRRTADTTKAALLAQEATSGGQVTRTKDLGGGDPRSIARALLGEFGFGADQFGCLDSLWTRESGWNPYADNPTSSAYGIPQALPGSKMASAGPDWATNPATQIRWGLGYIAARYGSPCSAWGHSQSVGWY